MNIKSLMIAAILSFTFTLLSVWSSGKLYLPFIVGFVPIMVLTYNSLEYDNPIERPNVMFKGLLIMFLWVMGVFSIILILERVFGYSVSL
jgi:hypothetical protein